MSRIGVLDLPAGISGDMFLGALVDAGAPLAELDAAVRAVAGDRVRLRAAETMRGGLRALKVDVLVEGRVVREGGGPADPEEAPHEHDPAPHREAGEIERRIREAPLAPRVGELARAAFAALAAAEAHLHGTTPERVHFHELGSWDAIGDIVGTAAGFVALGLDRLYHGPVMVGGGLVETAHGPLPVPAPATARLLAGRAIRRREGAGELATPTGAALLVTLAEPEPGDLVWTPERDGYGAGRKDPHAFANVARLTVGETEGAGAAVGQVAVLETSLDDATGEEAGHLLHELFAAGALDATWTPILMKKSRPGFLLRVIARPAEADALARRILETSPAIGVRIRSERRLELARRMDRVRVDGHEIAVKVARTPEGRERPHVEYEDLRTFAARTGLALAEARRRIERAWEDAR